MGPRKSWFRVQGSAFSVQCSGFREGFRVQEFELWSGWGTEEDLGPEHKDSADLEVAEVGRKIRAESCGDGDGGDEEDEEGEEGLDLVRDDRDREASVCGVRLFVRRVARSVTAIVRWDVV